MTKHSRARDDSRKHSRTLHSRVKKVFIFFFHSESFETSKNLTPVENSSLEPSFLIFITRSEKKHRSANWCNAPFRASHLFLFLPQSKRPRAFFSREDSRPHFLSTYVMQLHPCKVVSEFFTLRKQTSPRDRKCHSTIHIHVWWNLSLILS